MSKHDSSLSKAQYDLLKSFKKQITNPHTAAIKQAVEEKAQVQAEPEDDLELFRKQMQGVQKMDNSNIAKIDKSNSKKTCAQVLAKRAAAEGPMQTDLAELSDTKQCLTLSGVRPISAIALQLYNTKYLKTLKLETYAGLKQ